jgi:hypothetical protein
MPMAKSGAKALGNITLRSGADFLGDVLASTNVKEAAKAQTVEAANVAKRKAINKLRSQTGSGKRAKRSRSVKRSRNVKRQASISTVRRGQSKKQKTVKKRKTSTSTARHSKTKRRKTAQYILG